MHAELKRWDRIRWVRELSSAIVSDGTGAAAQAAKFARSARVKSEEYQQRYRLKCRQIFEKQVRGRMRMDLRLVPASGFLIVHVSGVVAMLAASQNPAVTLM